METMENIKTVIIGSKSVGKTSFLNSYVTGPNSSAAPFESLNGIKIQIEENIQLELWDTNSADHSKMIRKLYYEGCSVVLVCFSVMDHKALRDVRKKVERLACH